MRFQILDTIQCFCIFYPVIEPLFIFGEIVHIKHSTREKTTCPIVVRYITNYAVNYGAWINKSA